MEIWNPSWKKKSWIKFLFSLVLNFIQLEIHHIQRFSLGFSFFELSRSTCVMFLRMHFDAQKHHFRKWHESGYTVMHWPAVKRRPFGKQTNLPSSPNFGRKSTRIPPPSEIWTSCDSCLRQISSSKRGVYFWPFMCVKKPLLWPTKPLHSFWTKEVPGPGNDHWGPKFMTWEDNFLLKYPPS